MSNSSVRKGQHYEALARDCLQQQGLTLIEHNYHSRFSEIDLIMLAQQVLCSIEVKFCEAKKYCKTVQSYISSTPAIVQKPMRFDALILQFVILRFQP